MNSPNKTHRPQDNLLAIRPQAIDSVFIEGLLVSPSMKINNGVATIPIQGVLQSHCFWCLGYEDIRNLLESAVLNSQVHTINLEIDSPGGEVLGVSELADFIYASRVKKPIIAIVRNMACSAAYWLAAACNKIILAGQTTVVGSIGVLAIHIDKTEENAKYGVKITEISTGKYKNLVSPNHALSAEGSQYLQDEVNEFYKIFTSSIAKYRSMSSEKVLTVSDGREFIGKKAIELGLADSMQGVVSMNPEEMQKKIDELTKENEMLRKEIEDLKKQTPQEPEEKQPESSTDPQKKDEEEKKGTVASAVQRALAMERERIVALDELDRDEVSHHVVLQAKKEGWSAEKTALQILTSQPPAGKQNIRSAMRQESKIVPSPAMALSGAEVDEQILNAMAKGFVQKRSL